MLRVIEVTFPLSINAAKLNPVACQLDAPLLEHTRLLGQTLFAARANAASGLKARIEEGRGGCLTRGRAVSPIRAISLDRNAAGCIGVEENNLAMKIIVSAEEI